MTEHDLLEVVEIEEESGLSRWGWAAYYAEMQGTNRDLMLIARVAKAPIIEHQRLAGYIVARESAGELHINNVAVRNQFRRRGIGIALLGSIIEMAKRLKVQVAFLEVRRGNNAAQELYKKVGAEMYFGSDENLAGATAGERIASAGGTHPLCVIQASGSVALESRCAGVKSKASGTENIQVNGADDSAVVSSLQAKLSQDKSIDYIVTLGAPIALDALKAMDSSGSKAKLITFDLNADAAQDIKDGKIEFSIDQQPYVQGYQAVTALYLKLKNGNDIGGGGPVLTGPSFVDKSNIDVILPFAKKGTR